MSGSVAALLLAAGCETERIATSELGLLPPEPRAAPAVPAGARPGNMILMVGARPEDTNGNGFPDRIDAVTAIFPENHPMAMVAEGTFVFVLYRMGEAGDAAAKPIAEWRFEGEALRRALGRAIYGPSYRLALSLLAVGGDELPPMNGDLRGRFEPATAGFEAISCSDEVRAIQLGRRSG